MSLLGREHTRVDHAEVDRVEPGQSWASVDGERTVRVRGVNGLEAVVEDRSTGKTRTIWVPTLIQRFRLNRP